MKNILIGIFKVFFTTFLVATITFLLLRLIPGGPFTGTGNKTLPPEIIANLESKYHLNEPLLSQYALYLKGLLKGDLGPSLKYINRSVNEILFASLPISFLLGVMALLIAIPAGLFFGITSAFSSTSSIPKVYKFFGNISLLLLTVSISLPNFLIAALLINIFALKLKLLPVALWESPYHMILPVITLSFLPAAYIARIVRTQMINEFGEEYIRTLMANGLKLRDIIFKHALKNSLISIVTILGPIMAILITGSFVVEFIFAIPGMGRYFITAFTNRDYFLITGTAIVFSFLLTTLNVVIDGLYRKIDPRIG